MEIIGNEARRITYQLSNLLQPRCQKPCSFAEAYLIAVKKEVPYTYG